jgi:hypothetical protein
MLQATGKIFCENSCRLAQHILLEGRFTVRQSLSWPSPRREHAASVEIMVYVERAQSAVWATALPVAMDVCLAIASEPNRAPWLVGRIGPGARGARHAGGGQVWAHDARFAPIGYG